MIDREWMTGPVKAVLALAMVFTLSASFSCAWACTYSGGTGEPNNPYRIATTNDLNDIGNHPEDYNKCFLLVNDINLSAYTGTQFNIIGPNSTEPFAGVFDGNDHTISNFTYQATGTDYVGLFGCVDDPNATVKDLTLTEPNVSASGEVFTGALVAWLANGTVYHCGIEGGSVSGGQWVGGLVGDNSEGSIFNSWATVEVSAHEWVHYGRLVGGLVGDNGGTISGSYSTGNVSGAYPYLRIGGLAGSNSGSIRSCWASASVSGFGEEAGGLVGGIHGDGSVFNCYSTGGVSGNIAYVGGLIGSNHGGVGNSFWDTETSGHSTSDGGKAKTTTEMKTASTFFGWNECDGVTWTIDEGNDYPHLAWENTPGQPLPDDSLSDFVTGAGTETHPYLIYTPQQLNLIGLFWCELDKHYKLMADVDLSSFTEEDFNIIGGFTGVFDGNDHTISNFTYTTNETCVGLFGYVSGSSTQVKNLGLIDPNVGAATGSYIGSLVGRLSRASVTNCHAEGGKVRGRERTGGLVGSSYKGNVANCSTSCSVSGTSYSAGGLIGYAMYGSVSNSFATGNVSGFTYVGGLVGWHVNPHTISHCYATGNVSGYEQVGGLVGADWQGAVYRCYSTGTVSGQRYVGGLAGAADGSISMSFSSASVAGHEFVGGLVGRASGDTISNSYTTGRVDANAIAGGLAGFIYDGTIEYCYAAGVVSADANVGGLVGFDAPAAENTHYIQSFWDEAVNPGLQGIGNATDPNVLGKSTAEMQTESTFTDAGWDFVAESVNGTDEIWRMCWDGGWYPRLAWQFYRWADFLCPDRVDLKDFFYLAGRWAQTDCAENNNCDGADLDYSGVVDYKDLKILTDLWLKGRPAPGELAVPVSVDLADYAVLTGRWLHQQCWLTHNCCAADLDFSGAVDWADLKIFCEHWLEGY